jgi:hypothetical protein
LISARRRRPTPFVKPSRSNLVTAPPAKNDDQPASCGRPDAGIRPDRGHLIRRPFDTQNRRIRRFCFARGFNEADEHPRHATTTVDIRSKPFAPGITMKAVIVTELHPFAKKI